MKWREMKVAREVNLPLYLQLADVIRGLITSGELQPMERIPVSRELQSIFLLSSVTVERGISCLVEEGYLLRRPRIGTFVAAAPPAAPPAPKREVRGVVKLVFTKILPYGNFWFHILFQFERRLRARNVTMQFLLHEAEHPLTAAELAADCLGVIFCGVNPLSLVMELHSLQVPFVIVGSLDRYHPAVKEMDQITGNDVQSYTAGIRHLLRLGHRRILVLTAQAGSQFTRRQMEGCRRALAEFGLKMEDINFLALPDEVSKELSWEEMLRHTLCTGALPTAISAYNGIVACTALRAIARLGLKVPDDISVITYDPWYAELTVPALTVIPLGGDYSEVAVQRLFLQLDDPEHRPGPCIIGDEPKVWLNESSRFYTEKSNGDTPRPGKIKKALEESIGDFTTQ